MLMYIKVSQTWLLCTLCTSLTEGATVIGQESHSSKSKT